VPDRLPRSVYDAGRDPDPRFSLANERTFLAWIRTALALTAGAIAVHAPALDFPAWARLVVSTLLLLLAGLAVAQGWLRWRRTEAAMRAGGPMPGFAGAMTFAAGIGLLVLAALAASLFTR
jgi:putative membrane protein